MAAHKMEQIEVESAGNVAVLTLKRPGQGNRITERMASEVTSALESARKDPLVRACVVTGHGDLFCLGGDFQGAGPTMSGRTGFAQALIEMDRAIAHLGKPLVAAVNGDAHAGGFGVVIACDLAVAADDATFGLPEAAKGLFPFIAIAMVRDAIPKKLFFDIVYNARLISAGEALAAQLVNEMVPRSAVLDRAIALAQRAASYNAEIVKLGRDLYYGLRGAKPDEAYTKSRIALLAALAEKDRSEGSG